MIRISDKSELVSVFKESEQNQVEVPDHIEFPLGVKDMISWSDSNRTKSFLVFKDFESETLYGAVFKRSNSSSPESASSMCDWCHRIGSSQDVSLYTVNITNRHSIGAYICDDLKCRDYFESPPGVHGMRETLKATEKIERLYKRIGTFLKKNIF